MSHPIFIPKRQLAGLATLRDLGPDRLSKVTQCLKSVERPIGVADLEQALSDELSRDEGTSILRQLISITGFAAARNLTPDDVVEGLTSGLNEVAKELKWSKEKIRLWRDLKPGLTLLFGLPQLHVVAKALSLAYDYANLLQSVRIITDIRPVFDEQRLVIEGAAISQTLRLVYDSGDQTYSLSIALDADDVEHLRLSCERALGKARQARTTIKEGLDLPIMIAGESNDD